MSYFDRLVSVFVHQGSGSSSRGVEAEGAEMVRDAEGLGQMDQQEI